MEKLMAGWLNPYANATFGVLRNFPPILPIKCPLWVISGHCAMRKPCPLYPRKRTLRGLIGMSAKCQLRTIKPIVS
jgi:hypothetical protein